MTPDTDTRRAKWEAVRCVTLKGLDALVAEHVMEWPVYEQQPVGNSLHSHVLHELGGVFVMAARPGEARYESWRPSTDWRHTGELWERLVSEGWRPSIDEWCGAVASVSNNDACNPRGGASGAEDDDGAIDPRVALCLAALRAYGVEVELETEVEDAR